MRATKQIIKINGEKVYPGERKKIHIEVATLFDYTQLNIPLEVINGLEPGPVLFISAAIHGDEINGIEIIKRLLKKKVLNQIKGAVILVPVVNVFGFNTKSRYLPDRRDLNRCFPGTSKGSLGARLASIFMKQIVNKCTHGIDLHTGAIHRSNLPQIRACLEDDETNSLAHEFGTPVVINSKLRDGSLRDAAQRKKVKILLFEGGEALRFDENSIRIGLNGCLSIMRKIGMIPPNKQRLGLIKEKKVYVAQESYWVRAHHSGSFVAVKKMGDHVQENETLAVISDPFGSNAFEVKSEEAGIIIGMSTIPLVSQGDAMIHIATFENTRRVKEALDIEEINANL